MLPSRFPVYPRPQTVIQTGGTVLIRRQICLALSGEPLRDPTDPFVDVMPAGWQREQTRILQEALDNHACPGGEPQVVQISRDGRLPAEGYSLKICNTGIEITAGDGAGLFYALRSLRQILFVYGAIVPAMAIEDHPDFKLRGVLLDIGRGKIPKMKTLFQLIDLLSDLKINHLQLYMEGYAFAYKRYAAFFPDEAAMTADEFRELDRYARSRFIELVPCQNCLGHMEAWLSLPEFKALAEVPEGLSMVPGLPPQTTTLDPLDPGALELVKNLFDELLPNFSADLVNINLDEPYELGRGKNRLLVEAAGVGPLYFDYLMKILAIIRRHQKKAFLWGDVLLHDPVYLDKLPPDVTVLDWLYEGKSTFEPHARLLHAHQTPFVVCPGTSSWNSIAGRTDNMMANILDAAETGLRYGAFGLLVTDWGDYGHWQTLPVSYAGYAYAAATSWNLQGNRGVDTAEYLDTFVFKDADRVMGHFWQDLGNYYLYENASLPNMTLTFLALSPLAKWDTRDDFYQKLNLYFQLIQTIAGVFGNFPFDTHTNYDYHGLKDFLDVLAIRLELNQMRCDNREIVYREALYTLQLIRHGANLYQFAHEMTILPHTEIKDRLATMLFDLGRILDLFNELWMVRNRKGGSINRSAMGFHILLARYQERLSQINEGASDDGSESAGNRLQQHVDQRDKDRRDEIDHLDPGNLQYVQSDGNDQQ